MTRPARTRPLQRPWPIAAIVLSIAGCTGSEAPPDDEARLALGLLPDESAERQRARYAPLVQALSDGTGLDAQLVVCDDYDDLVGRFGAGEIDLAYFGGVTFIEASEHHGAVPLVMRDVDARFVSEVIVHTDSPAQSLEDLRGKSFAFGSHRSTSGHYMPRHWFERQGMEPEGFFSGVVYSGAHDKTVEWVAAGVIEAGVANGQIVRELLSGDDPPPVRVLWQTPAYVDYVWAARPDLPETTREAIRRTFLSLSTDEAHRPFLRSVGARYYIPAATADFDTLRAVVDGVGARGPR